MERDNHQGARPKKQRGGRGGHNDGGRGRGQPRGQSQVQRGGTRGQQGGHTGGHTGGHRGGHRGGNRGGHQGGQHRQQEDNPSSRGRGQGRGSRPRGRGGRSYDDSSAYQSMQESAEVRNFFNRWECKARTLDGRQFLSIVTGALNVHSESPELRHQFLIRLTQCKFLEMDGPIVGTIMTIIPKEKTFVTVYQQGISSILDMFDELLYKIPHTRNTQPYVTAILDLLEKVAGLNEDSKKKIQQLKTSLQDASLLLTRINDPKQEWSTDLSFIKEPIIPEIGKLLNESLDKCYLNPIKGGYTSSAHYLETWFRLMREDFLGPLRKAVKDFQVTFKPTDRMLKRVRLDGGYHYTVEKFALRDEVDGESMVLAEYATDELKHVNWNTTDRLRGDSLMVMSDDHFQTARYAMIAYHDSKPAKRGQQVWLRMLGGPLQMTWCHGIEPMAYYEPTRCVMERLKIQAARIHDGGSLPMSRYLVETNKTVLRPKYMIDGHVNGHCLALPGRHLTSVQSPDISSLGLDYSQEEAMKLALTHELALIQGPPGTGKSYVGAMFVHIMMLNKQLWQKHEHGCMLLLAYKNHAIDQFIGECERIGMDMSRTVRVGSRSSAAMDKYQLSKRRRELQDRFEYHALMQTVREKRRELLQVEYDIKWLERMIRHKNADMPMHFYTRFLPDEMMYELSGLTGEPVTEEIVMMWISQPQPDPSTFHAPNVADINRTQPLQEEIVEQIYRMYRSCLQIPVNLRAPLFAYWCQQVRDEAFRTLVDVRDWHRKLTIDMKQIRHAQDIAVVRRADIIAMTTTGASKHGHLVDEVKPTIVLCEEAAEVLESHIVAPLTDGCKHVVLIGDHQQLRPSVANFDMEKRNLSISLFERLITNGLPSRRLQIQHRMHPDIASLLVPHIYDSLDDHESVKKYPPIKGIEQRMHFFCHENNEEKVGEKSSCRNPYEADYVVALCHYLLNQGYGPRDITILTTYMGQMRLIREKINTFQQKNPEPTYTTAEQKELLMDEFSDLIDMVSSIKAGSINEKEMENKTRGWFQRRKREFEERSKTLDTVRSKIRDVRVTTVDNYQGEECTIIILSFVRSNKQCNIGFLKWANRICVALSRAKHGFYAIGNFKLFANNQKSDLWKNLCQQLLSASRETLAPKLQIRCQVHSTSRYVNDPGAFLKLAPIGGCTEKCDARLECGHVCTQLCHPTDRNHSRFVCIETCEGKLSCGHDCRRRCDKNGDDISFFARRSDGSRINFRTCQQCYKNIKCDKAIEMKPEKCGHTGMTVCHEKESYMCLTRVEFVLPCTHPKKAACSSDVSRLKCERKVTEILGCGHEITRKCHNKNPICLTDVTQTQTCGHERTIPCYRRHEAERCGEKVDVKLPCEHERNVPCHERESTLNKRCEIEVPVDLKCGHVEQVACYRTKGILKIRYSSITRCKRLVTVELPCHHKTDIECNMKDNPGPCEVNVTVELPCGHQAEVLCKEKKTQRTCRVKVPIKRSCGHIADVECCRKDRPPACLVPRQETLKCGHTLNKGCSQFALAKAEGCQATIEISKSCGHKQMVQCRENEKEELVANSGCSQKCLVQCSHGTKCPRQCRQPCRRCPDPCQNQCPHSRCTRLCWEDCNRTPCDKPCARVLNCGHICGGFCGELCPKICTQCNAHARKGRRIRVAPCDHDFPMKMLDKHMHVRENEHVEEVVVKLCPLKHCKRPIMYCNRYMNQVKRYTKLTKMAQYTGRGSWWYCKPGGHYMNFPSNENDLKKVRNHLCTDFRELRSDNFYMDDDSGSEEEVDDGRPPGLVDNELLRLMRGQGFGRGAYRRERPRPPLRRGVGLDRERVVPGPRPERPDLEALNAELRVGFARARAISPPAAFPDRMISLDQLPAAAAATAVNGDDDDAEETASEADTTMSIAESELGLESDLEELTIDDDLDKYDFHDNQLF